MSNTTDWLSIQYSCTHWEWGRQGAKPKLIDLRAVSIAAFIESHHAVRIEEKSMEMALLTVQFTAVLLDDPVTPRSNCLCAHYCFWALEQGRQKTILTGEPIDCSHQKDDEWYTGFTCAFSAKRFEQNMIQCFICLLSQKRLYNIAKYKLRFMKSWQ